MSIIKRVEHSCRYTICARSVTPTQSWRDHIHDSPFTPVTRQLQEFGRDSTLSSVAFDIEKNSTKHLSHPQTSSVHSTKASISRRRRRRRRTIANRHRLAQWARGQVV